MTYYRRRTLEAWEVAAALAAGAVAGMGVTYLARIWLRRNPTGERGSGPEEEAERPGPDGAAARRRTAAPRPTEGEAGRRR